MSQIFIDQTIRAIDTFYWLEAAGSETPFTEHILHNLAILDDESDGSDF